MGTNLFIPVASSVVCAMIAVTVLLDIEHIAHEPDAICVWTNTTLSTERSISIAVYIAGTGILATVLVLLFAARDACYSTVATSEEGGGDSTAAAAAAASRLRGRDSAIARRRSARDSALASQLLSGGDDGECGLDCGGGSRVGVNGYGSINGGNGNRYTDDGGGGGEEEEEEGGVPSRASGFSLPAPLRSYLLLSKMFGLARPDPWEWKLLSSGRLHLTAQRACWLYITLLLPAVRVGLPRVSQLFSCTTRGNLNSSTWLSVTVSLIGCFIPSGVMVGAWAADIAEVGPAVFRSLADEEDGASSSPSSEPFSGPLDQFGGEGGGGEGGDGGGAGDEAQVLTTEQKNLTSAVNKWMRVVLLVQAVHLGLVVNGAVITTMDSSYAEAKQLATKDDVFELHCLVALSACVEMVSVSVLITLVPSVRIMRKGHLENAVSLVADALFFSLILTAVAIAAGLLAPFAYYETAVASIFSFLIVSAVTVGLLMRLIMHIAKFSEDTYRLSPAKAMEAGAAAGAGEAGNPGGILGKEEGPGAGGLMATAAAKIGTDHPLPVPTSRSQQLRQIFSFLDLLEMSNMVGPDTVAMVRQSVSMGFVSGAENKQAAAMNMLQKVAEDPSAKALMDKHVPKDCSAVEKSLKVAAAGKGDADSAVSVQGKAVDVAITMLRQSLSQLSDSLPEAERLGQQLEEIQRALLAAPSPSSNL